MKRSLVIKLMVLFMCVGAWCTTVTSTTKIVGPDGQPFTGTITLQLPFAGVNSSTNQLILATPVTASVINGIITQPFAVAGNDLMSPAMPYSALYTDSFGTPVTRQLYYITGTTFDVGSAPATPNFLNTNNIFAVSITASGNISVTGTITGIGGLNIGKFMRDCRTDGVVADGVTNDRTALNSCIANAYTNGQNVQLPSGRIHVSGGAVNDTNKPNMVIRGVESGEDFSTQVPGQDFGTGITQVMCDTGTVCWDMTGSAKQYLEHFSLRINNSYSTPSTGAVLMGRDNAVSGSGWTTGTGTYCFASGTRMHDIYIFADHNAAATAIGTYGIYNINAETFTFEGGGVIADAPFFFSTSNDVGVSSPFQTLQTGCAVSMTEIRIHTPNGIQSWLRAPIELRGVLDFESDQATEFLNGSIGTNHAPCLALNTGAITAGNIRFNGQCENFDTAVNINAPVDRLKFEAFASSSVSPAQGLIVFNGFPVTNSTFNIRQLNGTTQPIVWASSAATTCKGCIIYEGSSTGSGTGASAITLTESTVIATGLLDAAVNTFAAGSSYDLFNDSGRSVIGILRTPGNIARVSSDFTSANSASLQAITGLSFALPATAINYTFHCNVLYSQSINVAGDQFGVASLTTAPTLLSVNSIVAQNITAGTTLNGNLAGLASTTPTAFVTFQPGITGNLGAVWDGVIEASGAGASTLQFYVLNGTGADLIVVKKDSNCVLIAQ